ncbi:MAG TPA: hypothetical protein VHM19_14395 [Polyangiales bacterium]|jgi:hypothetical protein|nr:hypothetical protein [Polyangiales bacterium]
MADLLALTLHRPWPFAILHLPPALVKRVENRPWKPWPSVIGKRIAIHAGKKLDRGAETEILGFMDEHDINGGDERLYSEGIVGTAVVKGWMEFESGDYGGELTERQMIDAFNSPWFFGPFGWVLEDVRALPEPIPCKGAQGLWRVPADIAARVANEVPRG